MLIAAFGLMLAAQATAQTFTNLHSFTTMVSSTNSDGANPWAGLILLGNALYGTAYYGGSLGKGTVFSLSFAPQLTIISSATNFVLTWPTNFAGFDYTGFTLQSTTNLGPATVWSTNLPAPIVVNSQNAVTNPFTGAQQSFRLISN